MIFFFNDTAAPEIYTRIARRQRQICIRDRSTGIKLKLLAALFLGKECIVNTPMVVNTGLEALCEVADTPNEMKKKIAEIAKQKEFSKQKIEMRKQILEKNFSNKSGALKLSKVIF